MGSVCELDLMDDLEGAQNCFGIQKCPSEHVPNRHVVSNKIPEYRQYQNHFLPNRFNLIPIVTMKSTGNKKRVSLAHQPTFDYSIVV